jgi:GntR family transcriptional regulator, transcriptional repressor for pyruvate dehydrogenase complex
MHGKIAAGPTGRTSARLGGHRLPDEIAAVLGREIRGLLQPGDRLQSEKQLGARFKVSRPVVREAISQLKSERLVQTHQGRGAFVADAREVPAFRISAECFAKRKELRQILELQTSIAATAAGLAAHRRSKRQLARMKQNVEQMATALVKGVIAAEQWVTAENHLLAVVFEASDNGHLVEFLDFLHARISARLNSVVIKNARAVEMSAAVLDEHRSILDAIRQRDGERARELASAHFTAAAERLAARADFVDA